MIDLQKVTIDDLGYIISLEEAPENNKFIIPYSHSRHAFGIRSDSIDYNIIKVDGSNVGFIINNVDHYNLVLEIVRIVIGSKGLGYGKATLKTIIDNYTNLKFKRIWLDVFDNNIVANNLYQKIGFKKVGQSSYGNQTLNILDYYQLIAQQGDAPEPAST